MKIYFDQNPEDGTVRFHHEAVLGARQIPALQTEAEIKAKKRPKMIDNVNCRVPEGATEITRDRFEKLMAFQEAGKRIVMKRGKPAAIDHVPDKDEVRALRRAERDRRLAASDWTQLIDVDISAHEQAFWAHFRQDLRDLNMDGTDWPIPPGSDEAGEETE